MIEADKLPDAAVEAALAYYVTGSTVSIRDSIAAFLNALDDEAMGRLKLALPYYDPDFTADAMRAALGAAVQEETG